MSCLDGKECKEVAKRNMALIALGIMAVIFLVLSAWSFIPARDQVTPDQVVFDDTDAVAGKRVFQAYNCMGCHTIVGNGAYFGPDLTKIYKEAGPAWLAAFLPSAGGWPTNAAVNVQLQNDKIKSFLGYSDMETYRKQFPGAAERMDVRGGKHTLMPNLPFKANEITALISFFKYTSDMNNEGWPPKPDPDRVLPTIATVNTLAATATNQAPAAPEASAAATDVDPLELGKQLAADMGCVACHATDTTRMVGPGWGGLNGSEVELADGTKVTADTEYFIESVRNPDAKVVAGYPPHVMPAYDESMISDADLQAIVAYLQSL